MSPGSLLLGNHRQSYECGHAHGTGDRCLALHYTEEFFERAHLRAAFPVHRIPPSRALASSITEAQLAIQMPSRVVFEELAYTMAGAVAHVLRTSREHGRTPTAADERRVSTALRFIEAN